MNINVFHTKRTMAGRNSKINSMIEKLVDKKIARSFAICDLNDVVRKYESWKLALPRIRPYYAVKCNNCPEILELLADLGAGFDCATKFEIDAILKTKCSADDIIFANTIKDANHVSYANSVGVNVTTFDSIAELEKCKEYYPNAKFLIRIKAYSNNHSNFEEKFGCDPYKEAPILLEAAKRFGLNVVGVAFHVGTICRDSTLFCIAIKLARHVFDVASQIGFNFNVLDIGGGFVAYTDTTIFEVAKFVNGAMDMYFPDENVRVIAEPGRYFVRSSMTLATKIICAKPNLINCSEKELRYMYYIDNGVFNMFTTVNDGFPATLPYAWKESTPVYPSTVFGQSMAPVDKVTPNVKLPKLEVGDWLIYEDMGAYTQCLQTEFHMYEYTPIYFIKRSIDRVNVPHEFQGETFNY